MTEPHRDWPPEIPAWPYSVAVPQKAPTKAHPVMLVGLRVPADLSAGRGYRSGPHRRLGHPGVARRMDPGHRLDGCRCQ